LVLLPQENHLGISRQISDPNERERLHVIAESIKPPDMGLIVRTVAEGCDGDLLAEDLRFLLEEWRHIQERSERVQAPALLYQNSLVYRVLRDLVTDNVSQIIVDRPELYDIVVEGLSSLSKQPTVQVELYEGKVSLFEHLGLAKQLEMAQNKRVWLDCGGYLIIDETEALVSIDVNTGKYVGVGDLRETFLKTNLQAAEEIAWQLRLRNIGGIIIIDFIDMDDNGARNQVLARLEEALARDKTKTHVLGFTSLGLVEMTRKKTKRILSEVLQSPCPLCEGTGRVQSEDTVAARIVSRIFSLAAEPEVESILVKCDPAIAAHLIGPSASNLEELESATGKEIYVRGTPSLSWEDFQVISGSRERIAAQAHPVAVGDRVAAKIEQVHVSNPQSGIARVDGFVIDCQQGAQYVGRMVTLEILEVFKTYATARIIKV
jgi:ribonuclease G